METIGVYAREVFAGAYALRGPVPVPEAAFALCDAAVEMALEEQANPHVLSIVAEIAKWEGTLAALAARRAKLSKRWKRKIAPVPTAIAAGFGTAAFVSDVTAHLHAAGLGPDPRNPDDEMGGEPTPEQQKRRAEAKGVAVLALTAFLAEHPELASDWTDLLKIAEAEAKAEGVVQGTAMLEPQAVLLDLDELYKQTLANLRELDTYGDKAGAWLNQQLDGLAGDMGKAIADAIVRNFGPEDTAKYVNEIIDKGDGVQLYIDEAIHLAMQQGAVDQMDALGIERFDYVTMPDACPICAPLDSAIVGSYTLIDLPIPPQHINCRCLVAPAGTVS